MAVLLFCSWVLTCFVFRTGGGTHVLCILALICLLQAIITIPRKKYIMGNMKEEEELESTDTVKQQRA